MARKRAGFTLIEIVAVLLIVALLAGLGIASLRGLRNSATIESVTRQIMDYDRSARLLAERQGEAIDLVVQVEGMRQEHLADARRSGPLHSPLVLPKGFAIRDVWIAAREGNGNRAVGIGREGRSRSYGFRLEAPAGENRWMVVSGATGQQQVSDHAMQSREIQTILAQERLDAP